MLGTYEKEFISLFKGYEDLLGVILLFDVIKIITKIKF